MPAELDRLKAWMAKNGYTHESLSAKLYYGRTGFLKNVLNGKRKIGPSLRYYIALHFGLDAYSEVFGVTVSGDLYKQILWPPEKSAAHTAVGKAIKSGELLPAKEYICVGDCFQPAVLYHHPSYLPDDQLNVVPACYSCHQGHHKRGKPLNLGVVPTAVGLVRIAIAQPERETA